MLDVIMVQSQHDHTWFAPYDQTTYNHLGSKIMTFGTWSHQIMTFGTILALQSSINRKAHPSLKDKYSLSKEALSLLRYTYLT